MERPPAAEASGIHRLRRGKGFAYRGARGGCLRDRATLARIRRLAIPPAWTAVWICPSPRGHLQATGRDARGRKQYRYHPDWRARREQHKYSRLADFVRALPRIRRRVRADLRRPGLPREKVVATVVRLLEKTFIRIGNESYARKNGSYGLTTLRDHHVKVNGDRMRFQFRGKSGKLHAIELDDARLARIVKRCRELPGQELFQYRDEAGKPRAVGSADINDYLKAATGEEFTAKDFRTWGGTLVAGLELAGLARDARKTKRAVDAAIRSCARVLGNTVAVCRKSYVHPRLVQSYWEGRLDNDRVRPVRGLALGEARILAAIS